MSQSGSSVIVVASIDDSRPQSIESEICRFGFLRHLANAKKSLVPFLFDFPSLFFFFLLSSFSPLLFSSSRFPFFFHSIARYELQSPLHRLNHGSLPTSMWLFIAAISLFNGPLPILVWLYRCLSICLSSLSTSLVYHFMAFAMTNGFF